MPALQPLLETKRKLRATRNHGNDKVELVVYFPFVKNLPDLSISTRDFWLTQKQLLPRWFGLVRTLCMA